MKQSSTNRSPSFGASHHIFEGSSIEKKYLITNSNSNLLGQHDQQELKKVNRHRIPTRNSEFKSYEDFTKNQLVQPFI